MTNDDMRHAIDRDIATITYGAGGAGKYALRECFDVLANLESYITNDGELAKAKRIIFHCRAESEDHFALAVLGVSYEDDGTITNTVDMAFDTYDSVIGNCCDREFGYEQLTPSTKYSRRVPSRDATSATGREYAVQFQVELPKRIVDKLNQMQNIGRLHKFSIVILTYSQVNSQAIDWQAIMETQFISARRRLRYT